MTIFIDGHTFGYELQRVAQMFFPGERVEVAQGAPPVAFTGASIHCMLDEQQLVVTARLPATDGSLGHFAASQDAVLADRTEHRFGVLLYRLLSAQTGIRPPWGVLTGIRPVKLFLGRMAAGADEQALHAHFVDDRMLEESRFSLALQTARVEQPLLARCGNRDVSLYVSIPFCPTRCAYCSFVSHSVEKAADLIPAYLDRMCDELRETGALVKSLGLRLRTVYFGGGTPTSITAAQLERLTGEVAAQFDRSGLWEYTVEAGRPDTIDRDKLAVIRAAGADRISINPQTLSDQVLQAIGRKHTTKQTLEAYTLVREMGFSSVNMDLIAGLPSDTPEGFRSSIAGVLALSPENVTVHTLTVKRAAFLDYEQAAGELKAAREMVDHARQATQNAGYQPYYLYRQNGSLAALENVGYAKPGFEGLYNTYIMDESHSILAVGAGGSTKLCQPSGQKIKRIYNYKYPYEYISGFAEVLRRKEAIAAFYENTR